MPDPQSREERRTTVDRANRALEQSRVLRKLSDDLLKERRDLRATVKNGNTAKPPMKRR